MGGIYRGRGNEQAIKGANGEDVVYIEYGAVPIFPKTGGMQIQF